MRYLSLDKSCAALLIWNQVGVVAAILAAWSCLNQGICGADTIIRLSCVSLPLHLVWMFYSWKKIGRELFSPYSLFVVAVFVFNAGQACLEVLGLNRNGLLGGRFSESTLAQTLLLVLYALSVMHLGALIAVTTKARGQPRAMSYAPAVTLRRVAVVLFIVALIPTFLVWGRAVSLVADGGYGALYQAEAATGFGAAPAILSGFLMPSGFLLLAGSKLYRWGRVSACALIGSYVLLQLFLGFRGNAVVVLTAFLWLWHRTIRRLPATVPIAVLALIAVFVLPVVGITRSIAGRERMSLSQWKTTYAGIDNPAVDILSEMGGSMLAPAYTIQFVPSDHAYEFGASYAYAVLSLVPNLFWSVHPAAEHSPSKWLVNTAEPATARAGGGLGYSVIAEAYLNFGFLGAGVPMGLLGWGIGRLSRWTEVNHAPSNLSFVAIALVPLLIYARAEAGNVLRGVTWFAAIPYLMVSRWPKRYRRQPHGPVSPNRRPFPLERI